MSREIDVRDYSRNRVTPQRQQLLQSKANQVSNQLGGAASLQLGRMNPQTGNPVHVSVASAAEPLAAAKDDYIQRALRYAQTVAPALGLTEGQAPEFVADPNVQNTSSGARAVNLQQRYKGIPIFQGSLTVRFSPDGTIEDSAGAVVSVATDVPPTIQIPVTEAVRKAAAFVTQPEPESAGHKDQFGEPMPEPTLDISGFLPKVRAAFAETPEHATVLEPGPFETEIKASLVWFPHNEGLVLGWTMLLTFPGRTRQYRVIVDANSGETLYSHQLVQYVAAVGNVYRIDGGSPRQMTNFPRTINDYGIEAPATGQTNWRWCHKCQGLYFAGNNNGVCPAAGAHDHTGSGDYMLMQSGNYPGQANWRWCHKCQGLYFAGDVTQGHCPAGGAHDHTGSGNYVLLNQKPLAPGQHMWRWCHKCEGLYFAGNPTSGSCPAGGGHDATGSGEYSLLGAATGLPSAFPDDWVAATQTVGNPTNAHLGAAGASMTGTVVNGVLTFNPADPFGDDQKVLNIYYYCCFMHDFSYLLGFREANGNFQTNNFGRGGVASDPVDARSFPGAVFGTANMSHSVEGTSPIMQMGLVTSTGRHTAFDSTVVFHEFQHGVSNRLVGGGMILDPLAAEQSGSMNEGWSDYMACSINNVVVLGNWVLNNTGGIRAFPYDSNYPDGFDKLGTGRYNEVHNVGEIWCATLMEMSRRTDRFVAMQLVLDALKLTPANPSFLDGRDAIVSALNHMFTAGRMNANQRDGAWQGIWSAFARFGMGPGAHANGALWAGNTADYTLGQDNWRWCKKCQTLFFSGHATKGVCSAGGAHNGTASGNYNIPNNWPAAAGQNNWRWCHKCENMYFAGGPTQGVCAAGGTHDHTGSGDYRLVFNAWGSPGQYNWRWCHKCQSLHFAGNPTLGNCAAGGVHGTAGSGDYSLIQLLGHAFPLQLTEAVAVAAAGGGPA